jgi:hypothetical protein
MSYDSSIVLAIKSGVFPMFCCCQGDDDELTGTGSGNNKANVYWTNSFTLTSRTFVLCQGCRDIVFMTQIYNLIKYI